MRTAPQDLDGKYRLGKIVKQGDRSIIFAATHLTLREPVVVKVLHADERDPRIAAKLRRSARQSAALRSEHVVRYLDVGHLTDQRPYVVMERLSGETLEARIARSGPLDPAQAIAVVLQTCEALACAHARGIIHRDLRSSNVFCTEQPDGRIVIKVLNFGTARGTDATGAQEDQGMTVTALAIDDPDYKSPEQIVSRTNIDARTDTWSLAVILYEVLTGVRPFAAPSAQEVVRKILGAELSPSSKIPSDVWNVIRGCINLRREERWDSVATIADALAHAAPPELAAYPARVRQILAHPIAPEAPDEEAPESAAAVTEALALAQKTIVSPPAISEIPPEGDAAPVGTPASQRLPRIEQSHTRERSFPWMRVDPAALIAQQQPPPEGAGRIVRIVGLGSIVAAVIVVIALLPRLMGDSLGDRNAPAATTTLNAPMPRTTAPAPAPGQPTMGASPAGTAQAPGSGVPNDPAQAARAADPRLAPADTSMTGAAATGAPGAATPGRAAIAPATPQPAPLPTTTTTTRPRDTTRPRTTAEGKDPFGWDR